MFEERRQAVSGIEAMTKALALVSAEIAEKDKKVHQLEEKLALSDLLKQVNVYMGSILDFDEMLEMIDDVLAGVMGVSSCAILVDIGEARSIKETVMKPEFKGRFDLQFFEVTARIMGVTKTSLMIQSLEKQSIGVFNKGTLLVYSIKRGTLHYGYLAAYYEQYNMMTKQREEFFGLIAGQLGVYFENARLYTQMKEYAITDGLTQLRNRAYLDRLVNEGKYQASTQIGVFMLDIDNFKKVNDSYGHPVGDEVLRVIGRLTYEETRRLGGRAFRYGGEEVISVITDKEPVAIVKCAKSLLSRIKSEIFVAEDGTRFQITASFGVCTEGAGASVPELIKNADLALYEAKHTGKNRVVAFRDPVMPNVKMSTQ